MRGTHPGMEDHFLAGMGIDAVHVYSAERVAVLFSVVEVGPHLLCEFLWDVVHSACAVRDSGSALSAPLKGMVDPNRAWQTHPRRDGCRAGRPACERGIVSSPDHEAGSSCKKRAPTLRCCSQSSSVTSVTTMPGDDGLRVVSQEQKGGGEKEGAPLPGS